MTTHVNSNLGASIGDLAEAAANEGRGTRAATRSIKKLDLEMAMKMAQFNGRIECNNAPGHEGVMLYLGYERIAITDQKPSDIGGFAGGDRPLLRVLASGDRPGRENINVYGPSENTVDKYIELERKFLSLSPAPVFQFDKNNCGAFIAAAGYTQDMDNHSNPTWKINPDLRNPEGANKRWCSRSPFHGGTINPGINKNALGAMQLACATIWMRLSGPNHSTGDPGDRETVISEYYGARRAMILGH